MRRRKVLTGTIFGLSGVSGCTGLLGGPPLDKVQLSIFDVRTPGFGGRSITLPIVLELENTADAKIPSPSGEFDVYVNDEFVVSSEPNFNTPTPGETSRETIEIIIDLSSLSGGLASAIQSGEFELALNGAFRSNGASKQVNKNYQL